MGKGDSDIGALMDRLRERALLDELND